MKLIRHLLVFCFLFLFLAGQSYAAMLNSWHWRNPAPFANSLRCICYGDGKFVAAGDGGVIHTSLDGVSWDDGRRPAVSTLFKVIFANGQFIAVGDNGTIVTSSDGYSWTNRNSGVTNTFYSIVYGNGKYVASGQGGRLTVSTDGTNWQPATAGTTDLKWITFGNGVFVLPGPNQGMSVLVSTDAQTWVSETFPNAGSHQSPHILFQTEFGNGMFVAAVQDEIYDSGWWPVAHFYQSSDGTNWVQGALDPAGPTAGWQHGFLTFLNGFFYEFATQENNPGNNANVISQTANGNSCNNINAPIAAADAASLAYGTGTYVLTAGNGELWTSTDATNWTANDNGWRTSVHQILHGGGNYIVLADSEPVLTSPDGINFTVAANSPTNVLNAAACDGTNYVAVGVSGNLVIGFTGEVYTSTNSADWVRRTSNTTKALAAICHGPTRWVAVGASGTVISSPNTPAWTLRSSGTANNLSGVAYGNGTYAAVGSGGTIITSPDGATWDVQYSGTTADLTNVRFLNGQFFATGINGALLSSTDGNTWIICTSGTTQTINDVAFGNGYYLTCGNAVLESTNGAVWQDISTNVPVSVGLNSIAFLDGSFWLGGDDGALLQSDSADGVPRLAGSMLPGHCGYQLKILLNVPTSYRILVSTNPAANSWQSVATNTTPASAWADTNAPAFPIRLYRVASP